MTINFKPGEFESLLKEYFKDFDFYLEKFTKEDFFKRYISILGIMNNLWSKEQKDIIYNAYLEAHKNYVAQTCRKGIARTLETYNATLKTVDGKIYAHNDECGSFNLF